MERGLTGVAVAVGVGVKVDVGVRVGVAVGVLVGAGVAVRVGVGGAKVNVGAAVAGTAWAISRELCGIGF
jgi:hypothetical protein